MGGAVGRPLDQCAAHDAPERFSRRTEARPEKARIIQRFPEQSTVYANPSLAASLARQIPADTDTFRLSTVPSIGMRTSSSQFSRVSRRMPSPSAPSTHASGPCSFIGIQVVVRPFVRADDPDALLLQFSHRPREIRDGNVGHGLRGAARDFGNGRVDAGGTILGRDHRVNAQSRRRPSGMRRGYGDRLRRQGSG